jgi:hypothetical protein
MKILSSVIIFELIRSSFLSAKRILISRTEERDVKSKSVRLKSICPGKYFYIDMFPSFLSSKLNQPLSQVESAIILQYIGHENQEPTSIKIAEISKRGLTFLRSKSLNFIFELPKLTDYSL